jgi:predicted N-acetyltransferase YhbS
VTVKFKIRPYTDQDIDAILQLSLMVWEPIFASFEQILGPGIYTILYPDWRRSQKEGVEKICKDTQRVKVLVAEMDGKTVGFLAYKLKEVKKTGEVQLLAVHPDHQDRGIGTELNLAALDEMKIAGMKIAVVETGGEPSHAPARRAYKKAGYTALPLVRYFKDL